MSYLSRAIGAVKLASKAHAPTIMVVSGVVTMGASVITASKKTLTVERVLEPYVEDLENIQVAVDNAKNSPAVTYGEKAAAKDRGAVYGHVAVDLSKHYFVPGVLFLGGSALVFGGHHIMLKRNATLAIAFTGVKQAFEAYRSRVRDEFGPMADQAMLSGHRQIEVIDDNDKVQLVNTRDWDNTDDPTDPYNRIFDRESSSQWIDDLSVNKLFIQNQVRMAQIRLGLEGYLYLCDLYQALGFPETPDSRVVGWKSKRLPDGTMNIPVIDVGLDLPMPDDWKYSRDNAIYLDFNCSGLIVGGRVQKALERA